MLELEIVRVKEAGGASTVVYKGTSVVPLVADVGMLPISKGETFGMAPIVALRLIREKKAHLIPEAQALLSGPTKPVDIEKLAASKPLADVAPAVVDVAPVAVEDESAPPVVAAGEGGVSRRSRRGRDSGK